MTLLSTCDGLAILVALDPSLMLRLAYSEFNFFLLSLQTYMPGETVERFTTIMRVMTHQSRYFFPASAFIVCFLIFARKPVTTPSHYIVIAMSDYGMLHDLLSVHPRA